MSQDNKITVILVDDSSVIRSAISRILTTDVDIEIVGTAVNGALAISLAQVKKPNVIILDIEMPVMDGLTAIPGILKASPETKIIMCSSLTAKGANTSIKAMSLGAVDCIVKPSSAQDTGKDSYFHRNLLSLVKTLGISSKKTAEKIRPIIAQKVNTTGSKTSLTTPQCTSYKLKNDIHSYKGKPKIIAIGSSTGGPQALFNVLKSLGKPNVPIVITQHMPATFTKILAQHITENTGITAHEGEDGMIVEDGKAYVAPGGKHMLFENDAGKLRIKLDDGANENYCKPSVDPMLRSLIKIYKNEILCVILTGMGQDGLLGARALSDLGGLIFAQDEQTSVVWGMPGAVANDGICSKVLPLDNIGASIRETL